MQTVPFIKMHGAGNDFVVVECRGRDFIFTKPDIIEICDRYKGIGCDQLVLLQDSEVADVKVEFYNGDGSVSGACGNGTRCAASLIMMQIEQDIVTIETAAGVMECYNTGEMLDSGEELLSVNMGQAKDKWQDIPLAKETDTLKVNLPVSSALGNATCVSMGNPHAVFFVEDAYNVDLQKYGPEIENHELFPQRVNVGIAKVISRNEIDLRVWERGAGETLACGSGACASVVAGIRRGLLDSNVIVHLPGGDLKIEILENKDILMTGPVAVVFTGEIEM